MEAKQCLNVLRQLGKCGTVTLQVRKASDGWGPSLAALLACGCVIPGSDFNIFMLWLQNANVDLSEEGDPDFHPAESGILSASDGIQLRQ